MTGRTAAREIRIVYFAWVRERIGVGAEVVALPPGILTIADLASWLATRGPGYGEAFRRPEIIRAAIDHTHAQASAPIAGAREIAFFPPVTGG